MFCTKLAEENAKNLFQKDNYFKSVLNVKVFLSKS